MIRIGIDGLNIRSGGGISHLVECLQAYQPEEYGRERVIVFGDAPMLERLPNRPWLDRRKVDQAAEGTMARLWYQRTWLTAEFKRAVDIALVPGGTYLGSFRPFVALAQNLLPFDHQEQKGYRFTQTGLRLRLLEWMQGWTFRRANGIIYMSEISRAQIEHSMRFRSRHGQVIHHGVNPRFFCAPKPPRTFDEFSHGKPFRLLYLSALEPYKHQDVVIEAVASLHRQGFPITLDLVGPGRKKDEVAVRHCMRQQDPQRTFVKYRGEISHAEINSVYTAADSFVFASSCETFGIILLEAMAGGLPMICSHRSTTPEIVGRAGIYFDPLDVASLVQVLRRVFFDAGLRQSLSFRARLRARDFSWEKCANETFAMLRKVHAGRLFEPFE